MRYGCFRASYDVWNQSQDRIRELLSLRNVHAFFDYPSDTYIVSCESDLFDDWVPVKHGEKRPEYCLEFRYEPMLDGSRIIVLHRILRMT